MWKDLLMESVWLIKIWKRKAETSLFPEWGSPEGLLGPRAGSLQWLSILNNFMKALWGFFRSLSVRRPCWAWFYDPKEEARSYGALGGSIPTMRRWRSGWITILLGINAISFPLAPQEQPFKEQVWQLLQRSHGETKTYGQHAEIFLVDCRPWDRLLDAILTILVPCHRVMGKDGQLTSRTRSQTCSYTMKRYLWKRRIKASYTFIEY